MVVTLVLSRLFSDCSPIIMNAKHLKEKEYRSDHEVGLLDNVNSLREEKILCDVTFHAEGGEVSAHRNILAAFSDYYKAMFTSKCKEGCTDDGVNVVGITDLILNLIIRFIYTAKITINNETVYKLYEAADMLQIKYVKDYCVCFLKDTLEVENCLIVRAFAEMYNIPELVTHCDNFFLDNFELVSNGLDFKELNPDKTEALIKMTKSSDSLSKEMIFRSIINWVKHDLINRQQFFERLFQLIDIKKLPTSFLKMIKKTEWSWMKKCEIFLDVIVSELINRNENQPEEGARAVEVALQFLVVGGDDNASKLVSIYDVVGKHWRNIVSTSEKRCGSTSVKINNHVYTAGGGVCELDITDSFERLDLDQLNVGWHKLASMNENRVNAASAVLSDQMFTVGGSNGDYLSSTEVYNPVVDTWTLIAPMKTRRYAHALVSYNGCLYAFGGYNGNYLNSMESIDPRMKEWKKLKSMTENRGGLCGVYCNGEIYAIGGEGLGTVERYNFRTNSWTKASRMNFKRVRASACVVNGRLYVIGGYHDKSRTSVEVYDPTMDEWKIETKMKMPRRWSSVVAL